MKYNTNSKTWTRIVIAAAIAAAVFVSYKVSPFPHFPISAAHAAAKDASSAPEPVRKFTSLPDFSEIAAQQGPAVVNISVEGTSKTAYSVMPGFPQLDPRDPFSEFFRRFQPPTPRGGIPTHGLGSGFIVSPDGIILTNAHVVANADVVTVKLTDRREFKAKVIGIDKTSDVAVLKIEAKNLPVVKIGNPDNSRVGEWVVAIGAPFGFENSVTAGIVSAKSRTLPDEGYVPFLQTDVAINPGNSGGPLFNLNGEVIGINSQIYSQSGGYQGLSFAIPIDVAMKVERQLVDHGKVSRGRLGVVIQEVTKDLADSFGMDKAAGALVSSVEKGSAADKAGIEAGDVILQFNGKDINRSAELPPLVLDVEPDTKAQVLIWHHGKSKEISMSIGSLERTSAKAEEVESGNGKLGLAVRPLTPDERRQAEVSGGLLVQDVADGPAARAGIQPGDVILSVNGEKIANVDQLLSRVNKKNDKSVALLVLRDGNKIFVPIKLG
ncbi:MAG: DegQ family serine endoprotease [Burkholderiaceae bacterium]